jgi:alkylation response protein AidB-like acyl-CoA dehydrogenase
MDFSFTEDQTLFQDSIGRFLEKEYDFSSRRKIVAGGGYAPDIWAKFAELGWLGACLPEAIGGFGGSSVEAMIVMEKFGRYLVVEPFLWTVIVGGELLSSLDPAISGPLIEQMITGSLHLALATVERHSGFDIAQVATQAKSAGNGWVLNGRKPVVPNGAIASKFFVTARLLDDPANQHGVSLFLVDRDAPGVVCRPYQTHDGHNAAEMTLENVSVDYDHLVGQPGQAAGLIELAMDRGIAGLCAEAAGSASHLVAATTAYLKTRQQYGAPLAKLQVLQHRLADMYVAAELIRSMAYLAALSLDLSEDDRKRALSAAKVQVAQSLRFVAQQAVQLHGGMGVSEELDIAHHLKRATVSATLFGNEAYHLNRFQNLDTCDG